MFRDRNMKGWGYAALALLVSVTLGGVVSACKEEPTQPLQIEEQPILRPGLNVYLTVDSDDASPGGRVRVTARVRAVEVDLTPTGFQVEVRYDPEKLEPLEAPALEDGVLRAVNLSAEPGLIRAAGAAANGFGGDVLFALEMKVKAQGYRETLAMDAKELTVTQKNFADVAADVVLPAQAVVVSR
jgi:hypothetical protein